MKARRTSYRVILAVLIVAVLLATFELGMLPIPYPTSETFGIRTYHNAQDADSDGIDDQADILQSARAYVATRPRYQSTYFEGGWPTDGTGVCTDVVAYALRGAGYNLQTLVDADICSDPDAYGISQPDANIDYRRVSNLETYLGRHATSLICDIWQRDQWQGGDIVVFPQHIAIVSDKRGLLGIPFLIHHARPAQISYEEDMLLPYALGNKVVGHYRL